MYDDKFDYYIELEDLNDFNILAEILTQSGEEYRFHFGDKIEKDMMCFAFPSHLCIRLASHNLSWGSYGKRINLCDIQDILGKEQRHILSKETLMDIL